MPALIVWKLWDVYGFDYNVDIWLRPGFHYSLHIQWVVKFFGIHLRDMALSYGLYRMTGKIYSLRIVMAVNLAYSLIDFGLFLWSFNKGEDVLLWHSLLTVVMSFVIIYYDGTIKAIKSKRKNKQSNSLRNYPKQNLSPQ